MGEANLNASEVEGEIKQAQEFEAPEEEQVSTDILVECSNDGCIEKFPIEAIEVHE